MRSSFTSRIHCAGRWRTMSDSADTATAPQARHAPDRVVAEQGKAGAAGCDLIDFLIRQVFDVTDKMSRGRLRYRTADRYDEWDTRPGPCRTPRLRNCHRRSRCCCDFPTHTDEFEHSGVTTRPIGPPFTRARPRCAAARRHEVPRRSAASPASYLGRNTHQHNGSRQISP